MRIATMQFINGILVDELGIPYAYGQWAEKPPGDYFVGESIEEPSSTREEDGHQSTTFILRGYTSGEWLKLQTYAEKIERNITRTAILDDGTGVTVFYDYAMVVPTGVAGWKSIKINLKIQEWKVN